MRRLSQERLHGYRLNCKITRQMRPAVTSHLMRIVSLNVPYGRIYLVLRRVAAEAG